MLAGAVGASLLVALPAVAAKTNNAGAVKYEWHLSGDVMPVPPYGSLDIPGSDAASKLIVNQPSGKVVQANITGVMNGLEPLTEYTVYLSNVYTPFEFLGWDVAKSWVINVNYQDVDYPENLILSGSATSLTGSLSLVSPAGASPWTIDSGSVTGDSISLHGYYNSDPAMTMTLSGTIAADGSMSGTWADEFPGTRTGTWSSTSGQASKNYSGTAGWPGLLTSDVQPFTFMTNDEGSGSWHVNLKGTSFAGFSAWVNSAGGTILISDPITLN